jgi:hypothetical protein
MFSFDLGHLSAAFDIPARQISTKIEVIAYQVSHQSPHLPFLGKPIYRLPSGGSRAALSIIGLNQGWKFI